MARYLRPVVLALLAVACSSSRPPDVASPRAGAASCPAGRVAYQPPEAYLACGTDADCAAWSPCCEPVAIARRYLPCVEPATCPMVTCHWTAPAHPACVEGRCRLAP